MKRKSIAYLIVLIVITSIALFSGCVEEENIAPIETSAADASPTSTPEQEAVPTPNSTPEQETVQPTPTPEVTVELPTLEPGYEWYQDDEYGYKIAYPADWGTSSGTSGTISYLDIYPQGYTSIYGEEEPLSFHVAIYMRVNSNQTETRFWETGEFVGFKVPISLEELKKQGRIIEYKDITVNGKDGIEVVFDPIKLIFESSELIAPPTTARYIVFTNNDLDYIIQAKLDNYFYDEYEDTFEYVINSFIID